MDNLFVVPIIMKIMIGLIDSGITKEQVEKYSCEKSAYTTFVNDDGLENSLHGSLIADLLMKNLDKNTHCLVSIKVYDGIRKTVPMENFINSLKFMEKNQIPYINVSMSSDSYYDKEEEVLRKVTENSLVYVASGNERKNLSENCTSFPACNNVKKNFIVVGSNTYPNGNFGGPVTVYEDGYVVFNNKTYSGTSFSTPRALNKAILKHEKSIIKKTI